MKDPKYIRKKTYTTTNTIYKLKKKKYILREPYYDTIFSFNFLHFFYYISFPFFFFPFSILKQTPIKKKNFDIFNFYFSQRQLFSSPATQQSGYFPRLISGVLTNTRVKIKCHRFRSTEAVITFFPFLKKKKKTRVSL